MRLTNNYARHLLLLRSILFAVLGCVALRYTPLALAQMRHSPTIRFNVLDKRHGLPNNIVFRITQDRQGFMWFATMDGLARWDGYSMRVWRHSPDDAASLSSSDIRCLMEDSVGMLWIGTQSGGVNRFDPRTETFTRYRYKPNDNRALDGDEVTEIYEDKAHRFWILAAGTVHLFDRKTGTVVQKYRSREAAANPAQQGFMPLGNPITNTLENAIHAMVLDENGEILVSGKLLSTKTPAKSNATIVQQWGALNSQNGKITPLFADTLLNNGNFSGEPRCLNDSLLFVGSQNSGMVAYNTRTRRIHRRYLPDSTNPHAPKTVCSIALWNDRSGRHWIHSIGGGVMLYHPETDDVSNFLHNPKNPASLPYNTVMSVFEDRSGIVWFGTPAGAAFYDPKAEKFTPYSSDFPDVDDGIHPSGNPLLPSTRLIFSMAPSLHDPNALWICATSEAGLTRFDTRTERITRYRNTPQHPKMMPTNNVYHTAERADGTLWLGLRHGGIVRFDPQRGVSSEQYVPNRAVMPLLEDSLTFPGHRVLWAGDLGAGLYRINPATKELKNYSYNTAQPRSFIGRAVFEIARDKHGRLWFGSMNGLSLYHPATDDFTNFTTDPVNQRSLSCNYVECVVEDSKGRLWIGTEDGLNLFDEQTHDFTRFGVKDGLPSAVVLGIVEDKNGNLWLSTNHGLSCFNPEQKTFRNYDETDGLHGNTFNSHAYCRTADGHLWFGGVGGFSGFHPDSLRDNDVPPHVVLTDFRVFNKPVRLDTAIAYKQTLNYTDNFFTMGFVALNFTHPEKNRYKYKLEGFDRDWIDAGTKHEANYTNLDGGEYVFRVIACNNDGVWNTEGTRLFITITPPFWKTRWFLALGLLSIIGATASGMRLWSNRRLRQQHRDHELETMHIQAEHKRQLEIAHVKAEAQAHERERIFRDIHDGLGAHIVEIAAMTEQLRSELPPADEFLDNATQNAWVQAIMLSVHDLRSSLREIVWLLNMENDSLEALVSYLRQETSRVLENASITVSFSIDDILPDKNINPEMRRNVVMAVREAYSNIIKHAAASAVEMSVHYSDGALRLSIRDNGRGFTPESVGRFSNGTKTMQKRMALCQGTMILDSVLNVGTTVVFSVPI